MQAITEVAEITVSYYPAGTKTKKVSSSADAVNILMNFYPADTINLKEYFVVLYMDTASHIIGAYRLSEGGMTATVADIRLVLAVALKIAAKGIIISHNHPSSEKTPSAADKTITTKLKDACLLMDLTLCDHIIVTGGNGYYSFCDGGDM